MPQQINLFTPLLLTPKRYFSARTMAVALGVFMGLGALLVAFGMGRIQLASEKLQAAVADQAPELARLRAAVADAKGAGGRNELALQRALDAAALRLKTIQGEQDASRTGLLDAQLRHSVRLDLVARTIPERAWVTRLALNARSMEVDGYTIAPDALNTWVADLAGSPGLRDHALVRVKVALVPANGGGVEAGAGVTGRGANALVQRTTWAFSLTSAQLSSPERGAP